MKKIFLMILGLGLIYSLSSAEPIKIGVSLGLTGKYSNMAVMQNRAFRMWENKVNQKGGILGRPVNLVIHDDQSDVQKVKEIYLSMIKHEKMDLLFAPYSSGLTAAILPITEKYGYPILTSGASADSIWKKGYTHVFGVYTPASRYTLGFLEMVLMNGISKIAVIASEDNFSQSLASGTKRWINRLGLELVLTQGIKKNTTNLEKIAEMAKQSGSEAIIMCGHYNEAVVMRQAMKAINWYPKAYFASVGPVLQAYQDKLGSNAQWTFSSTNWQYYEKLPFPGADAFNKQFLSVYKVEPSYHAATAYAACLILESAIKRAGGPNRKHISELLSTLDMMTLLGRYGVDSTGMQIMHFMLTIQWIDGKKEVVWPKKLSTAEPVFAGE